MTQVWLKVPKKHKDVAAPKKSEFTVNPTARKRPAAPPPPAAEAAGDSDDDEEEEEGGAGSSSSALAAAAASGIHPITGEPLPHVFQPLNRYGTKDKTDGYRTSEEVDEAVRTPTN